MINKWTECDYPENFDKMTPENQQLLIDWINRNLRPIKSFNPKRTSYGMKQRYASYCDNGEFKGAMLKAGYRVKDKDALNWVFNVSEKSPLFNQE